MINKRIQIPKAESDFSARGDAVRCTWLISSDCRFDSYRAYSFKRRTNPYFTMVCAVCVA